MLFKEKSVNARRLLIAILIFSIFCDAKTEQTNSHTFTISNSSSIKTFKNSETIEFLKININSAEVYISNTISSPQTDLNNLIMKKKDFFVKLFEDDRDPYSGAKIERKKCLKQVSEKAVDFVSGPENLWSDCRMNKNTKSFASKRWIICHHTLWEITIKATDKNTIKNLQMSCL